MSLLCSGSRRVESSLFAIVCYYARFTSALLDLSFFFREHLDAKAAFVTASTAIDTLHMICMPLPSNRQMLGRRSRIPVSCAGCLVFIRSLFARVDEVTSVKWRPGFNLTSSFRTSI